VIVILLLTAAMSTAVSGWFPRFAFVAVTALGFALAFTYSRGAHLAALVGIAVFAAMSWPAIRRTPAVITLVLPLAFVLLAYTTSFAGSVPALARQLAATSTWRAFVSDPTWSIEQRLTVPGNATSRLWAKTRAAPGSGYEVQVSIDGKTIYQGVNELPTTTREWVAFDFPADLIEGKDEIVVIFRLIGRGDQGDRYFEVEGTDVHIEGTFSRFNGPVASNADLSPDAGVQTGTYAILLSTVGTVASPSTEPSPSASSSIAPSPTAAATPHATASIAAPPPLSHATPPALPTQFTRTERSLPQSVVASIPQLVVENDRWALWGIAVESFAQHPVFGIGFYSSSQALRNAPTTIPYANFHNQFLEFLADSGAVGLLGLVGFFAILLAALARSGKPQDDSFPELRIGLVAALVALIVALQFGSFFADSRIAGLTWILAGLVGTIEAQRMRGATVRSPRAAGLSDLRGRRSH
jgi:hypothetical protein